MGYRPDYVPVPEDVRLQALRLWSLCAVCGVNKGTEVDHITPDFLRAVQGHTADQRRVTIDEVQLLCPECHSIKTKGEIAQSKAIKRRTATNPRFR